MTIYTQLGVRRIINARGYSTKCGGGVLPAPVLEAMREAAEACARIADLQEAAGRAIAEATGAEAAMVTSGAAAALTLGAAACLPGKPDSQRPLRRCYGLLPFTMPFEYAIVLWHIGGWRLT